ncbi:UNVERIFIED_CONTAM: DUF2179 domain-containing protein, partial [Lactobacillus acidophilus]|nr:DUF2179 domain-containing protein [Lactobacillus acidophilus]
IYTKNPQAIADQLKDFTHGATMIKGTGVYTNQPTTVVQIVTPRGQFRHIRQLALTADPSSFIVVARVDVEVGNYRHFTF